MANNNHFLDNDPVWLAHKPRVELLAEMGHSPVFVVVREGGYPFLSPKLEIFGYDVPAEGWSPDDACLKGRVHPDDRRALDDLLTSLFHHVSPLPEDQRRDYKYIIEMRLRAKNNDWIRIVCQLQILDFSAQGKPIELGTIDIAPDQTPDMGLHFTLMNVRTGEIIPFDPPVNADVAARYTAGTTTTDNRMNNCTGPAETETGGLTAREREVLEYIDRGLYSKDISDRLSISIHTVNRHRQNILEKTNTNNAREAINYARRLGLL